MNVKNLTCETVVLKAIAESKIVLSDMQLTMAVHSAQHAKRQGGKRGLTLWVADFIQHHKSK